MSYDPMCEDLARHLLDDGAPQTQIQRLAQWIQDWAEIFIDGEGGHKPSVAPKAQTASE